MSIPQATETGGDIHKKVLPGGTYAVMHCELTGPEEYEAVWINLAEWAEKHNYEMDMSKPSYEIYLNNPDEHPEKHHILDICLSVKLQ
jgi:AraC family transcriptional regulator